MAQTKTLTRPESETNIYVNLVGLGCFFVMLFLLNQLWPEMDNALMTSICMAAVALPILAHDIFVRKIYTHPKAGLTDKPKPDLRRVGIKLVGLYFTYAIIMGVYWLFPEYGDWYDRAFTAMGYTFFALVLCAPVYFWWVDSRQQEPEDSYYHLGRLLLTRQRDERTKHYLAEHARNWMVKGFFLPLMFTFLANNVKYLSNADYRLFTFKATGLLSPRDWFKYFFDFTESLIYTVDVSFAAIGYAMTFRAINGQIRSVEPTTLGWVICVVCYPPFWNGLFFDQYFNYDDKVSWGSWLWDTPFFYILWGSIALCLLSVYSWATVAMGYRFSNLTYRGLITSGPYRVTKHPAYVTKNTFFWLTSVPFISHESWHVALNHCLLIFGVNLIYYMRARTEERHLLNYPEYREYCEWIDEHGWFRWFRRFPCFDWRTSEKVGVKAWWKRLT